MSAIIITTARGRIITLEEKSFPLQAIIEYHAEGGKIVKEYKLYLKSKGLCLNMEKKDYSADGADSETE